jgi:hypothetical protein
MGTIVSCNATKTKSVTNVRGAMQEEGCLIINIAQRPNIVVESIQKDYHHHHQPMNVPTAGAQAFLMDYS